MPACRTAPSRHAGPHIPCNCRPMLPGTALSTQGVAAEGESRAIPAHRTRGRRSLLHHPRHVTEPHDSRLPIAAANGVGTTHLRIRLIGAAGCVTMLTTPGCDNICTALRVHAPATALGRRRWYMHRTPPGAVGAPLRAAVSPLRVSFEAADAPRGGLTASDHPLHRRQRVAGSCRPTWQWAVAQERQRARVVAQPPADSSHATATPRRRSALYRKNRARWGIGRPCTGQPLPRAAPQSIPVEGPGPLPSKRSRSLTLSLRRWRQ